MSELESGYKEGPLKRLTKCKKKSSSHSMILKIRYCCWTEGEDTSHNGLGIEKACIVVVLKLLLINMYSIITCVVLFSCIVHLYMENWRRMTMIQVLFVWWWGQQEKWGSKDVRSRVWNQVRNWVGFKIIKCFSVCRPTTITSLKQYFNRQITRRRMLTKTNKQIERKVKKVVVLVMRHTFNIEIWSSC